VLYVSVLLLCIALCTVLKNIQRALQLAPVSLVLGVAPVVVASICAARGRAFVYRAASHGLLEVLERG
jgi:hypothetical protein